MMKRSARQKGQAMAEVAVALPLFIVVIMAIAYFSNVVYTQQKLNVAVRYAAREMAIASTHGDLNRVQGAYIPQMLAAPGRARELVARAMGVDAGQVQVSPVDPATFSSIGLHFLPGGYVALFLAPGGHFLPPGGTAQPAEFGAGVLFYGCKASYRLSGLDWVAHILGIKQGVTMEASSLMPAELPLHGSVAGMTYGLADLNSWVQRLATQNVDTAYSQHLNDPNTYMK